MELIDKMIRAAKLDVNLYEEVEKDPGATTQAFLVVLIVSICGGIGAIGFLGTKGIIMGIIRGIIGWVIWSALIFIVGVKIFKHTSDIGELLRCLGFAYSPGALNILAFIPIVGFIVLIITFIWILVTFVIAVRQALDVETGRAILVSIIGFAFYVIISLLIGAIFGPPPPI